MLDRTSYPGHGHQYQSYRCVILPNLDRSHGIAMYTDALRWVIIADFSRGPGKALMHKGIHPLPIPARSMAGRLTTAAVIWSIGGGPPPCIEWSGPPSRTPDRPRACVPWRATIS